MQNAKDSFYLALRARLAVLNPDRTVLIRGTVRPGILVEDAEAPLAQLPKDVFVLRWLGLGADVDLASTMAAEECEILYQTCGTQSFGGLDRGRSLSGRPIVKPGAVGEVRLHDASGGRRGGFPPRAAARNSPYSER